MIDRSQWPDRGFRSRRSRHRCRRCLPSLKGWDARCDRLLVGQTNRWDLLEHRSPLDSDIAQLFGRDATSPESSVSAAVRWDIGKLVAQSQIRRYRSSHQAGTCSQMIHNSGTSIPNWETPFRQGPHPHRSERHSSGPRFIIIPGLDTYIRNLQLSS